MIKLTKNFKLFMPETDNEGNTFDSAKTSILSDLSKTFGGATVYKADGLWSDNDVLYNDEMNIAQVNYTNMTSKELNIIINSINKIFEVYKQLAVSLEINGALYILEPKDVRDLALTMF